ncbi:hypothetical protein OK015_11400 [Mycobacterium sp. Aquia_216]|uniref:alpha/beta fold hydrolase n=1 Tax=Mycobacterium sp. Aquia_216 TaxID=2991729 RepID=UPI00227BB548|nr:hypothetical protein [Mycobacterium sp. Aquia_216]WAJ46994.1 hypothetical protein OK015_11400 [Mycobacterium sp. Aquia_216]
MLAAIDAVQPTDRLADITVPARMLLGARSPGYLRAATAAAAARIPGTTIVAIPGQGHQATDHYPQQSCVQRLTSLRTRCRNQGSFGVCPIVMR